MGTIKGRNYGRSGGQNTAQRWASFILAVVLLLSLPTVLAQSTSASSSSSSSSTLSTSTSSSATSLSTSTTRSTTRSTAASSSSTPILQISGLPLLLTLPALNRTTRTLRLSLPSTNLIYLTISTISTTNATLLPSVHISTLSPPSFDLGSKSIADSASGGILGGEGANRRSRSSGTWKLSIDKGFGNWSSTSGDVVGVQMLVGIGILNDGSVDSSLDVGDGSVVMQLGASETAPLSSIAPAGPLLGDTTTTTALIFSPLLEAYTKTQPTYPNYTLPSPQLTFPQLDSSTDPTSPYTTNPSSYDTTSNLSLIIVSTAQSPTQDGLDLSLPAVKAANLSTGGIASLQNMVVNNTNSGGSWMALGGDEGWRSFWVVGGLVGETNYTAWVVDQSGRLSQPIWFVTKEANFPCQLLLPTTTCPSVAYAVPLPANSTDATTTTTTNPIYTLPDNITQILTSSLEAFSTSLLSTACGRDKYSQVSTCLDCYDSYRDWVCRIVLPRCGSTKTTTTTSSAGPSPTPQTVSRTNNNQRIPSLLNYTYDYTELLPCLSTCNKVDRTCPATLLFRCPLRRKNAGDSYAFVGDDDGSGDGSEDLGVGGGDKWGGRWCNGPDQ